jgi:thioredoxin reductase/ferredoxin
MMLSLVSILGCLAAALLCAAVGAFSRPRRKHTTPPPPPDRPMLIHSINDDRCIGCDACVHVCPTDVLELVSNKSRVARFDDCVQCEQCAMVCPTTALVMHLEGDTPPALRLPLLDEFYRAAPGLYLIGEAAGKPLVKNASNLGRAVVEHMIRDGLSPSGDRAVVDVLIVGSGPGGLSAALSCVAHGLSYVVIEKDELVASTIARYPKGKLVMAEPYDVKCVGLLPVEDSDKETLLARWRELLDRSGVQVSTREAVEEVSRAGELLEVRTSQRSIWARRVVLAVGTRGRPRRLGVPGEELAKVSPLLTDAALHRDEEVLVVGGGDSAVEAALALAETARSVTLSYRGKALSRCKAKNRQALAEMVEEGRVELRFGSTVQEIREESVVLKIGSSLEVIANQRVFVCIGGEAPVPWLERVGVRYELQPHLFSRAPSDQLVSALLKVPTTRRPPEEDSLPSVIVESQKSAIIPTGQLLSRRGTSAALSAGGR